MQRTRRAIRGLLTSIVVLSVATIATIAFLVAHAKGDEPFRQPAANDGSIPAVEWRPQVVGYYRPALVRSPSLFPRVFVRYRRAYVFEPLDKPQPLDKPPAADRPQVLHFSFE